MVDDDKENEESQGGAESLPVENSQSKIDTMFWWLLATRYCIADFVFSVIDLIRVVTGNTRIDTSQWSGMWAGKIVGPTVDRKYWLRGWGVFLLFIFVFLVSVHSLHYFRLDALVNDALVTVLPEETKPAVADAQLKDKPMFIDGIYVGIGAKGCRRGNVDLGGWIKLSNCDQDTSASIWKYFAFVSISTIGYGDVIPANAQTRLLIIGAQFFWGIIMSAGIGVFVDRLIKWT